MTTWWPSTMINGGMAVPRKPNCACGEGVAGYTLGGVVHVSRGACVIQSSPSPDGPTVPPARGEDGEAVRAQAGLRAPASPDGMVCTSCGRPAEGVGSALDPSHVCAPASPGSGDLSALLDAACTGPAGYTPKHLGDALTWIEREAPNGVALVACALAETAPWARYCAPRPSPDPARGEDGEAVRAQAGLRAPASPGSGAGEIGALLDTYRAAMHPAAEIAARRAVEEYHAEAVTRAALHGHGRGRESAIMERIATVERDRVAETDRCAVLERERDEARARAEALAEVLRTVKARAEVERLRAEVERLRGALRGLRLIRWRDDGTEDCWCAADDMPETLADGTRVHEDACTEARRLLAYHDRPGDGGE